MIVYPWFLRVFVIPEWSEKSFLCRVLSQFLSRRVKKFFVRAPSKNSQRGEKANRVPFQGMVLVMGGPAFK